MIFLDYQSTSPLDPRVVEKMEPYMMQWFGNPHSEHIFGWKSAEAIDKAQELIASLIGAEPSEILFYIRSYRIKQFGDSRDSTQ